MLQSELLNLESNELIQWESLMAESKQMTTNYLGQVNAVGKKLDAQAKEFHAKVDEIFNASKKQLDEMKKTSVTVLQQQESMASDGWEKVKQEIKQCEDKLRNGSMESLLQYEEKQAEKKPSLPKVSPVMPPIFTPRQIDSKSIKEMFGKLTEQQPKGAKAKNEVTYQNTPKPSNKANAEFLHGTFTTTGGCESKSTTQGYQQLLEVSVPAPPQRQLILFPSKQSSFDTRFRYIDQTIACTGSGLAWVRTGPRRLQLMDQHGAVMDTIDTEFGINDVVLSPQGELLLPDTDNKQIRSISPEKVVRTLFKTKWAPYGLCCLHSGDIAVTFYAKGRVVIFTRSGHIIQELHAKLFKFPHRVAQNKVNNDLYVCDKNTKLNSSGKIVALDAYYHLRYQYTGQRDTTFLPMNLCTDSAGRILITDYWNNRVHILDKDGQFLQYLQGLELPVSIDRDSDGNVWIGELYGGVKVVKYLK